MTAIGAEGAQTIDFFPEASDYNGAYGAAIAKLMLESGVTRGVPPDEDYVRAFARQYGDDPILTGLGAVCSFHDLGYEVQFRGMPSPNVMGNQKTQAESWKRELAERKGATFETAPPTAETFRSLINDPTGRWLIVLHAAGKALSMPGVVVQPTNINSATASKLSVHNPGRPDLHLPARTDQRLWINQVLGTDMTDRVSMLAVRRRPTENGGTSILTSPRRAQS